MRRSGRTVQFATRVSPEFDERIRHIAMRERLLLVEVLERALDAYEADQKKVST
jgi:predicted transcriptional regulator